MTNQAAASPGEPKSPPRRHRRALLASTIRRASELQAGRHASTDRDRAGAHRRLSPPASGRLTARAERGLGEEPDDCVERGLTAVATGPGELLPGSLSRAEAVDGGH